MTETRKTARIVELKMKEISGKGGGKMRYTVWLEYVKEIGKG